MRFGINIKKLFGSNKNKKNSNDEIIDEPIEISNEECMRNSKKSNGGLFQNNTKNFTFFDDLIHNGSKKIVLDSNIVWDDKDESKYLGGIELDVDDLVIDGNGHTIDACGKTRIFKCTGKNITIKNIILKSGYSEKGGAIHNCGMLTLVESTLSGNIAKKYGGAIHNNGELTILESTLQGNTAKENGGSGGAIHNNGELTITGSTLVENIASGYGGSGGAICNDEGILNISVSTLQCNTTEENGGAIHNNKGKLTITGSTFIENTTKREGRKKRDGSSGGAIHDYNGELTMTESTFTNNTSNSGGAIFKEGGVLTINESMFIGNIAKDGGAIYNHGGILRRNGKLNISKSLLQCNTAESDGGAIYNYEGEITIKDTTFTENTANFAVAIYNDGEITIKDTTLNQNIAESLIIYNYKYLKIFDCEILGNNSQEAIIYNHDYLEVHNTYFKGNGAKNVLDNHGNAANVGISNSDFIDNTVCENIIFNNGNSCMIEKSTFKNNIFSKNNSQNIFNNTNLTLISPKIKDENESILNNGYLLIKKSSKDFLSKIGGDGEVEFEEELIPKENQFDFGYLDKKIHESTSKKIMLNHNICLNKYEKDFYEGGIELDIDDLIIDGNGKSIDGLNMSRIFIITGKNITLKNIIFKNGHSHKNYDNPFNNNGGAIKTNHNSKLIIKNCEFINNSSESDGGAIQNNGEITIIENTLTGNSSECDGGAINNMWKMTINESILTNNTAKSAGGAINNNNELNIQSSKVNQNSADYGGAIQSMHGEISIIDSIINHNFAARRGGAIENNFSKLILTKSTVNNNGTELGGAIENWGGFLTVNDSSFDSNSLTKWGGSIMHYNRRQQGEVSIHNSIFNGEKIFYFTYSEEGYFM